MVVDDDLAEDGVSHYPPRLRRSDNGSYRNPVDSEFFLEPEHGIDFCTNWLFFKFIHHGCLQTRASRHYGHAGVETQLHAVAV